MTRKYWTIIAVLVMAAMLLTACGGGSEAEQPGQNVQQGNIEDDFLWNGDMITGFSTVGESKTEIVIPARCTGFDGTLFLTGSEAAKVIRFESSADIDIQTQFCYNFNLTQVQLPSGMTMIPDMAFVECTSLERMEIPAAVEKIGDYAFSDNTALEQLSFAGSALKTIGNSAFSGCTALTKIELPGNIEVIGENAFRDCAKLTVFTVPSSVKVIGMGAFVGSGLTDVYIPENVVLDSIGYDAFAQPLAPVTIHVVEGYWADLNFDTLFNNYTCYKSYD